MNDYFFTETLINKLGAITDEMAEYLIKSSFSTNIKERRDCSTVILDKKGLILYLAEHIPIHLGSFLNIIKSIYKIYSVKEICKNDYFISNDVFFGGGSHLPDIVMVTPVFYKNRLLNWVGNIAHHADFVNRGHENIYQEGIIIPPLKIIKNNIFQKDIFRLIINNCQLQKERNIDVMAQISANKVGKKQLCQLYKNNSYSKLIKGFINILSSSRIKIISEIQKLKKGSYYFKEDFDSTEIDFTFEMKINIQIKQNKIIINFLDFPSQLNIGLNLTYAGLCSTVYFAIKCILDPFGLSNSGSFSPIEINAKKGSMINCIKPAAVDGRVDTCQRIVDLIFGCFSKIIPDKVIAAGNGSCNSIIFTGYDPIKKENFIYLETIGGGSGARVNKNGLDGVHVHVTNTSNLPIECLENEYPIKILCYELIDKSYGEGKYRGGKGIRRTYKIEIDDCKYQSHGSRIIIKPWGLFGGKEGNCYKIYKNNEKNIEINNNGVLMKNETITIETAGGGGYGEFKKSALY